MVRVFRPETFDRPVTDALGGDPDLDLHVIFSSAAETKLTLEAAAAIARGLRVRFTIIDVEVVPYPLPLESPPVSAAFTERRLRSFVSDQNMDLRVEVYYCRDRQETIRRVLKPESIVVMKRPKRWLASARQIAKLLRRDGHRVILVSAEKSAFRDGKSV